MNILPLRKRIFSALLLLTCLLAACIGQGKPAPVASPTPAATKVTAASGTPTPLFLTPTTSVDHALLPTRTPHPTDTPSPTPAGEVAFQSTFNPKMAMTRTLSSPQKCPPINPALKPDFPLDQAGMLIPHFEYWPKAMEFLNAGGNPSLLRDYLVGTEPRFGAEMDLTGDGIPELVIIESWQEGGVDILTCKDGQFIDALSFLTGNELEIITIKDMNLDGIPEIALRESVNSAGIRIYYIYKWNGTEFQSLIPSDAQLILWFGTPVGKAMTWYNHWRSKLLSPNQEIEASVSTDSIEDIDGNGTSELVIKNHLPFITRMDYGPYRNFTETYEWNGYFFNLARVAIDPPTYRFQAVEDADRLSLMGEYPQALALYQEVISNNSLLAWSQDNYLARLGGDPGTPTPTLIRRIPDEYDNEAAYARYRIMLLRLLQHQPTAAQTMYNDLEKTYPEGQTGHIYAELASRFWDDYQASQKMGEACAQAIQFADAQQDSIFTYLGNVENGSEVFGEQGHFYTSWDLCPFQ